MTAVIGLLVALAVVVLRPSAPRVRRPEDSVPALDDAAGTAWARARWPLSVLAGVAAWTVLGGLVGACLGAAVGVVAWRTLAAAESPVAARRRSEVERDLPMAVHLLAAALSAGAATVNAVALVADAMPGAVADELDAVHRRLELGVDPVVVWSDVGDGLRPLGRTFARAHDSGSSIVTAIERLAEELRSGGRARRDRLARTVEVRAAAPLGLCFLPAFLLLGVVPMVAGLLAQVGPLG